MNKNQLIDVVSEAVDLPKAKTAAVLDVILEQITNALSKGEQIALVGFGTFSSKIRAARVGRDPRTGGSLQIPAAMVASFKAGKGLKDSLSNALAKEGKVAEEA